MIAMLLAALVGFAITIVLTPVAVRFFHSRSIGQHIREEVEGHRHKGGTPTMGGLVIILAVASGWLVGHLDLRDASGAWRLGCREGEFTFSARSIEYHEALPQLFDPLLAGFALRSRDRAVVRVLLRLLRLPGGAWLMRAWHASRG